MQKAFFSIAALRQLFIQRGAISSVMFAMPQVRPTPYPRSINTAGHILGGERVQAAMRAWVGSAFALFLFIHPSFESTSGFAVGAVFGGYALIAFSLWWKFSMASRIRPYLWSLADTGAITCVLIATDEVGMPLGILYVWVAVANGFRWGERVLLVSAAMGAVGFAIVVGQTAVWHAHPALSASIFLALIVMPLYAARLLRRSTSAFAHTPHAHMGIELQAPLNGIRRALELFQSRQRLTPEERELTNSVHASVDSALRQIENVLELAELEAGNLALERADFDLHEVVNSALDTVRPAVGRKDLHLFARFALETPFRLVGDAHRLRTALVNSLSNAVTFTERGYVCLDVSGVGSAPDTSKIRCEIYDTGVSYARAASDRTSERLNGDARADLGAVVATRVIELMGGRTGVESGLGRENLRWFELSIARQAAGELVVGAPNARVVLVSDDAVAARHYTDAVGQLGGVLIHVHSSSDALDIVARSMRLGNAVHAILVDAALAFDAAGSHRYGDLAKKSAAASIAIFVVSDRLPPAPQLRQWGYRAVLATDVAPAILGTALHSVCPRIAVSQQAAVHVAPWAWGQRECVRPRIFVADDNRTNLMIVRRVLEQAGYEVDTAETGDAALDRLSTQTYRLAILDMHMPGLDGLAVLRRYRMLRARSRMPVLVLTANVTLDAQGKCADAGADAYLAKPITPATLLGEVERLLRDREVEVLKRCDDVDSDIVATEEDVVLDISVLAELDRLYRDPRELARTIAEYEREGTHFLERVAQTCAERDHAAFCDAVHTLKGNAGNVGAIRLMGVCRRAETAGVAVFMQSHARMLAEMREAFGETLSALREQLPTAAHSADGAIGKS